MGSETGLTGGSYSITKEAMVPQGPHLPVPTHTHTHTATMGSSPVAGHSASAVSNMILSVAALCCQANPEHHIVGLGTNRLLEQQVVWV